MDNTLHLLKQLDLPKLKELCYVFAQEFKHATILDSCNLEPNGEYDFVAAFGAKDTISSYANLPKLDSSSDWWFGAMSYDCKNHIEDLKSENPIHLDCPEVCFYSPEILITVSSNPKHEVNLAIGSLPNYFFEGSFEKSNVQLSSEKNAISKSEYLDKIDEIQQLIREGEVYELNFCVNHLFEFNSFHPEPFQHKLVKNNPVPMASLFKADKVVLCGASMERFISNRSGTLKSQPIKGTISRGADHESDLISKNALKSSEKDRAENVMIVDLVRNDMNRICETGSVHVPELFGIHSFPKVHQMISTVIGNLRKDIKIFEVFQAMFPMGSMTGAPKIAAMKYIEQLEDFKREWYSGTVGYVDPDKNFDFNVVIRSLVVNMKTKKMSYSAGGAITIDSDPESEWEEMKLKTKSIEDVLNHRT